MHDETEKKPSPAPDASCPECGSARLRYRVQHSGVSHRPLQERSLLWECRQCAAHWSEPLFAVPTAAPSASLLAPPGP